jgi:transposase
MRPRLFRLSESDALALHSAYLHCRHADSKIRYQAVRLYGVGYSLAQIQEICACPRTTLLDWVRAYQRGGLPALLDHRQGGNRARLRPDQIEAVTHQLQRYTPAQLLGKAACRADGQFWNVADLARLLERDYGVVYDSPTSYRTLLAKCGLSYQRPAKQYKSQSAQKVQEFEELLEKNLLTSLNPLPTP